MSINTSTVIQGDYIGVLKKSANGVCYFYALGRKVTLEEIFESIEDETVLYKLSCNYLGKKKVKFVERGQITEPKLVKELADIGCDITSGVLFNHFVDSLRLQEEAMDFNNIAPTLFYKSLGWIRLFDEDGNESLCYRFNKLIGSQSDSKYAGNYYVTALGSYEVWCDMVNRDVVPFPTLQLVLVAALASVVIGILSMGTTIQNPIVHLNLPSGRGKSTAGYLAASIAGKAFDGSIALPDEDGKIVDYISVYQSWGATDNAMIATQAGNRGVVTVLNELGKVLTKNMTRLVFDLSEGSDKKRTNTKLESRVSKGYSTTFISTGESSLLDKCNTKLEGLAIRIMEITQPLTQDAQHANRIQDVCLNNCGHAAPILAEHIIQSGGLDYVLQIYSRWKTELSKRFPHTPSMERFVEKFAALFMATAEIANEALAISLDTESLLSFLEEYDQEHGGDRNTSARSYEFIVEHCHTYANKFVVQIDKTSPQYSLTASKVELPKAECWGKITRQQKQHVDGRWIVEELVIRRQLLKTTLKDNGYENLDTCIAEWKKLGVLDYEDDQHPCRYRTIDGSKERAYVFRVFATDEEAGEIEESLRKKEQHRPKIVRKIPSPQVVELLNDTEDEEVMKNA